MAERSDKDKAKVRLACGVIIAAMLLWMGAQTLGGQYGWSVRFAFLFDLAALAAFVWALFVLFQAWRAGPSEGS